MALCECSSKMHPMTPWRSGRWGLAFCRNGKFDLKMSRWGEILLSHLPAATHPAFHRAQNFSLYTGMYWHFSPSMISVLHVGSIPFTGLWNTNSSHPRPFYEINSHQYCPVKHLMAPCSTFWSRSIGMMIYPRDLHMLRAQLPTIPFSLHPFIP